jgi:hypothetical protein
LEVFTAANGLLLLVTVIQGVVAQQKPESAIGIALEPDATMVQHAMDANPSSIRMRTSENTRPHRHPSSRAPARSKRKRTTGARVSKTMKECAPSWALQPERVDRSVLSEPR